MKKLLLFPVLSLIFIVNGYSHHTQFHSGNSLNISPQDTLPSNTFYTGNIVNMRGVIDNDFFAASRQLNLIGSVSDDALLAGQLITITGTVGDMLMAAGENIIIDGIVEGDVYVAGNEVHITPNAYIKGDIGVAAQTVMFDGGTVDGQFKARGGNLYMNGTINNSADLYTDNVSFSSNYSATYGTTITTQATLHRENLGVAPSNLHLIRKKTNVWSIIFFQLWFFISLLLTGALLIFLFRPALDNIIRAGSNFWRSIGIGIIAFILIPAVILLSFILILTIPIGLLLMFGYGFILFASYLFVAVWLGVKSFTYLNKELQSSTYYWGLLVGIIYIAILTNIPYFGWLIHLIMIFFGLGSICYHITNNFTKQKATATI